jgi:signal peptidase II
MKSKSVLRTLAIVTILIVNVGCDQISKNIVRQRIDYNERIALVNDHLTLTKIENQGALLGLGQSLPQPVKILLLTVLPLASLGLALLYLLSNRNLSKSMVLSICFIIGGGIGNIYDRLIYGSVTDFLHIDFVLFETAIFNMADVSILAGIFVIMIDVLRGKTDNGIIYQWRRDKHHR